MAGASQLHIEIAVKRWQVEQNFVLKERYWEVMDGLFIFQRSVVIPNNICMQHDCAHIIKRVAPKLAVFYALGTSIEVLNYFVLFIDSVSDSRLWTFLFFL